MVLLAEPLRARPGGGARRPRRATPAPLVHFTPAGRPLDQARVARFAAGPGAILLCGRYEGVDQRFIDADVDLELSLGDYVLSGGELPALALLDAVARLQPGVLGDARSHQQDSFSDGLLDCPHYSRPERARRRRRRRRCRTVLLSGHHARDRALAARAVARADGRAAART